MISQYETRVEVHMRCKENGEQQMNMKHFRLITFLRNANQKVGLKVKRIFRRLINAGEFSYFSKSIQRHSIQKQHLTMANGGEDLPGSVWTPYYGDHDAQIAKSSDLICVTRFAAFSGDSNLALRRLLGDRTLSTAQTV